MSIFESDDESYDSYSETDEDKYIYEPEEHSLKKYNIVLCERYNLYFHGISSNEIKFHYLIHFRFKYFNFDYINYLIQFNSKCKPEIAECIYLNTGHCIGILKTFWLRIIQKKWKKVLIEQKKINRLRSNPNSLKYREIHGSWPKNCINYPRLKGLLSNLSRASSRSSA